MTLSETIVEFDKVKNNSQYFIEKYCKVFHPYHKYLPFILNFKQKQILNTIESNNLYQDNFERNCGLSSLLCAYSFWYAFTNFNSDILITSRKEEHVKNMLDSIKYANEQMPENFNMGVKENSKDKLVLGNNSKIKISNFHEDVLRGHEKTLFICDNYECIDENVKNKFRNNIIPFYSGKIFLLSTVE